MHSFLNHTRRSQAFLLATMLFALCCHARAGTASISSKPQSWAVAGEFYSFKPALANSDAAYKRFHIRNKPSWLMFSHRTGKLSGTPNARHVGRYSNIVVSATIRGKKTALPAFDITVKQAKPRPTKPPKLEPVPVPVPAPEPQPAPAPVPAPAPSPEPAPEPAPAPVPPPPEPEPTPAPIPEPTPPPPEPTPPPPPPNTAPVISGIPAISGSAGRLYSFTPNASDADGDTLTFSVQNKPSWATFNTSTGALSGTPTAAGQYSNIVIRVSDGTATTSLTAFGLAISPVILGSATVRWTAPTANIDGTPLTDLAGFRVLYGTNPAQLNQTLQLPSPTFTSVQIEELAPGTYYFTVKAYTARALESDAAPVVWKTIM